MLLFPEPQIGGFLLVNMNRESEYTIRPDIQEKMILARYAAQEGIPFDELYDSIYLDPLVAHFDDFFQNRKDQDYFAALTSMYDEIPFDDLDEEGIEFNARLWEHKRKFLVMPEVLNDVEGAEILRSLNPKTTSVFAAWTHGLMLNEARKEMAKGPITATAVARLVYWSQLHKITEEASRLFRMGEPILDMV